MIYLFDDSTYRGINPLDFTDCLCVVDRISPEQLSRMEPALQGASCIMIHKSYRDAGEDDKARKHKITAIVFGCAALLFVLAFAGIFWFGYLPKASSAVSSIQCH